MFFHKVINQIKSIYHNRSVKSRREYLRTQGAVIGDGTRLNCNTLAFGTEPYLIEVGSNCLFAADVHLITHDGGVKVLSDLGYFNGERRDKMGRIRIGNNVYIGEGAKVMPNVSIGDNCIIGACAVVTKSLPANSVAVGIPARVIKTLDEYYAAAMERGDLYPTPGMKPEEKKRYLMEHVPPVMELTDQHSVE